MKETAQPKNGLSGLVGKYFHSWREGKLEWQGKVVEVYGDTHIMVLLFEWTWGNPNGRKLVPLAQTAEWTFYETAKDMRRASWEYHKATCPRFCEGTFEKDEAVHKRLASLLAGSGT
jgi:hypothetical protein